jgi:hypothetical protein
LTPASNAIAWKINRKGGDRMAKAAERKDELIISALLCNPTVKKAAAICKVSEAQIYARLRDAEFKAKYDRARRELLAQSTAYLQGITGEALQKMYEIMNDPDAAPQVQLNAANAIASNSLKMTEQADILAQLEELKKAVFPE